MLQSVNYIIFSTLNFSSHVIRSFNLWDFFYMIITLMFQYKIIYGEKHKRNSVIFLNHIAKFKLFKLDKFIKWAREQKKKNFIHMDSSAFFVLQEINRLESIHNFNLNVLWFWNISTILLTFLIKSNFVIISTIQKLFTLRI